MTSTSSLRCFIIGEGSLPLQCAGILLQGGYTLSGVISSSSQLRLWALERGVAVYSPDKLLAALKQQPFDYLFSIVNPMILPVEALELPKQWAINYHDGPLPRYAGMYATSWALINQEKRHGITWHRMSPKVDAGEVLIQTLFDISEDETALTLNAKCYEAAIHAFQELVQGLPLGGVQLQPQNLAGRSLYPRRSRPQNGCTLAWKKTAAELGALCRGLNFGPYPNPLGMPKIFTGREFWLVKEMEVIEEPTSAEPGTITALSEQAMHVAAAQGQVCLRKLLNVDGQLLSLSQSGLEVGERLPELEPSLARRLSDLYTALSDDEPFWIRRLAEIEPLCIPPSTAGQLPGQNNIEWVESTSALPSEWVGFTGNHSEPDQKWLLTLTAWLVFLARMADSERVDLAIQSSIQNRLINGLESFFANSLPLCVHFNLEGGFDRLIAIVRDEYERLCLHGTYARDLLVRAPGLGHLDGGPHFPVGVALVDRMDEIVEPFVSDLFCTIALDTGEILWSYRVQAYAAEDIQRMQAQFNQLLQGISTDPKQAVGKLPLMDAFERQHILVDWNATTSAYPRNVCIHELFEQQAIHQPETVALIFNKQSMTYGELNARANHLAHTLRRSGIGLETLVGICVERSPEMVVGLLGVLKAGGAYVPLNPSYPTERLNWLLQDSRTPVLLTQASLVDHLPAYEGYRFLLDKDWETIASESKENLTCINGPENLAYVMYTSGSSGRPKGVCVTHRGVVRLVRTAEVDFGSQQVFLQSSPFSFDGSNIEIWGSLLNGGRLVIPPAHLLSLAEMGHAIQDNGVTVMDMVTGLFHQTIEHISGLMQSLRLLLVGGDVISVSHVQAALEELPDCRLINGYGPTENTTYTSYYDIRQGGRLYPSVPIGRPIANTQVYILDRFLNPVPVGVPGELILGGDGLARGYLNLPEQTEERFIPDPFSSQPGARLYRSGDRARFLPDGNIEFLGRIDRQVKIRGFRVEPGEVEHILGLHSRLWQIVVTVREERPGDKHLLAYYVPKPGYPLLPEELEEYARLHLPAWLVPSMFISLPALPLGPNGKVDLRALPVPQRNLDGELTMPLAIQNPVETVIAGLWMEVLGVERVYMQDDFFALGGHSLEAIKLLARISEVFRVEFPLSILFEAPSLARMAQSLIQFSGDSTRLEHTARLLLHLAEISEEEAQSILERLTPDSFTPI